MDSSIRIHPSLEFPVPVVRRVQKRCTSYQTMDSPSSDYVYILIPVDTDAPLEERRGLVAGGLESDMVQQEARLRFFGDTPPPFSMVDICTLCVPSIDNGYIGISFYSNSDRTLPTNTRATEIARACGHIGTVIYGDTFISRCHDDESKPWVRLNLNIDEVSPVAEWVLESADKNRSRNMKAYTSGGATDKVMHQLSGTKGGMQVASEGSTDGSIVSWSQTSEDIEV